MRERERELYINKNVCIPLYSCIHIYNIFFNGHEMFINM